ncbi:MAG: hypothetical protein QXZ66_10270 [Thermoproteota archaeon]
MMNKEPNWRKGRVSVHAWWEDEPGKPPVWHEHEVEVVERWHEEGVPDPNAHVLLKLDGKEVRVERFTAKDWKNWIELEKNKSIKTLYIRLEFMDMNNIIMDNLIKPEQSKQIPQCFKKLLAIYRLLWYFGPPYRHYAGDLSACDFRIKYKGYVFEISDRSESLNLLDMQALVPIPLREIRERGVEKKYEPPIEIKEEIIAIVEYLAKHPVMVYFSTVGLTPF